MKTTIIIVVVFAVLGLLLILQSKSRKQFIRNLASQLGDLLPRYFV